MLSLLHEIKLSLPWICLPIGIALCVPGLGARRFRAAERRLSRLARDSRRAILLCGALGFLMAVCTTLLLGIPTPGVHDEFSYLLAADTFAHGRLVNPSPPVWPPFESFQIVVTPAYFSKYPPGQGLILALGQVLTGLPIAGAWISAGLACGAICWMLYAWLPRRTALLGGLMLTVHPLILTWGHNYWGGLLALAGGALALGGFRHVLDSVLSRSDQSKSDQSKSAQSRHAAWMGIGIALLGLTRPFEGLVFSVLLLGALGGGLLRYPTPSFRILIIPMLVPILTYFIWTGIYNHACTGRILQLPYTVYQRQYDPTPMWIWQPLGHLPHYRHAIMREFYSRVEVPFALQQRTLHGFITITLDRSVYVFWQYLSATPLLWLLVALPAAVRYRAHTRFLLCLIALFMLMMIQGSHLFAHYVAPCAGAGYVLLLQCLRQMRAWRPRRKRIGLALARLLILSYLLAALGSLLTQTWRHRVTPNADPIHQRPQIIARLRHLGGKHLILVRYSPQHNLHEEWVYNDADMAASPVLWAREMDAANTHALLNHYQDRSIWLLLPDAHPLSLAPYPGTHLSPR